MKQLSRNYNYIGSRTNRVLKNSIMHIAAHLDNFIDDIAKDLDKIPENAYDTICDHFLNMIKAKGDNQCLTFTELEYKVDGNEIQFYPNSISNRPYIEYLLDPSTEEETIAFHISNLVSVVPEQVWEPSTRLTITFMGITDELFKVIPTKEDSHQLKIKINVERGCATLMISLV